uniref:Tumor suppressor candidate 2 n=1 Tax=Capra hircus TaxID=9925 RepID=A0A452ETS6_CAPHI
MGASGCKARGLWLFTSGAAVAEQALVRPRGRVVPPFVLTRRGSMFCDEDGDLAHEFYEETVITKNGQKWAKLRRVHKNLIPQGTVKLDPPASTWISL